MANRTIPFFGVARQNHNLRDEIMPVIQSTLETGILTNGPQTEAFEDELAKFKNCGLVAVAVSSGSLALEGALSVMLRDHDGVPLKGVITLCPALTFRATANAIIRAGQIPKFLDVDTDGIMTTAGSFARSSPALAVHVGLYGNSAPPETARFVPTIIDGAQDWITAPSTRAATITASFDATKNLTGTGTGGAVFLLQSEAEKLKQWRNNSAGLLGTNAKMSEVEAAVLRVKLHHLGKWQALRKGIAHYWTNRLAPYADVIRPLVNDHNIKAHSHQKYVIDVGHLDRTHFRAFLADNGIPTMVHYERPLHEMPEYAGYQGPGILSVASALARKVVSLPMHPELLDSEVEHIADAVISYIERYSNP